MPSARLAPRDLTLILAVVAMWGFSFVPIKVGLEEIPPFAFAALRFFFAAVPLVFFMPPPRMPAALVIVYGLAIGVFQFGLLFLGMRLGMPAGLSSLVIQLQAFFTIGLGIAVLGDRLHGETVAGAIVAGLGVALLALHRIRLGADSTLIGLALVIVAAIAWAVGNIVAKHAARRHHANMLDLVVWSSLAPPLPLLAASYAFEGGPAVWRAIASASAIAWGCALFLAYFATIFGFGSWARMLHRYPTGLVAPFALLIPVSGLASGALFLGESLAPMQMAGVGLVLAGLAVNVYGARMRGWLVRALPG
ncbi:MAG TPA: EamA family transporter [Casimicrobiaceae bacterium]|nr:EamA family transporter [Casimicrobiaceae bacterium]